MAVTEKRATLGTIPQNGRTFVRGLAAGILRPDLWGLPLLAIGAVLPSLLRGNILSHRASSHLYGLLSYVSHALRVNEIPSWNPYYLAGVPGLADAGKLLLYPLTIPLLLVLPVKGAINASIVLDMVLAGLFMHLYLGSLALSRPARFVGAMVYMLSGFAAGQIYVTEVQRLGVYTGIPLACYLIEEIVLNRRGMGAALLGGFVIAAQFFTGSQTFMYASLALVAYAVARFVSVHGSVRDETAAHATGNSLRAAILLTGMFLFAGGFAAIQLLPELEVLKHSTRHVFDPSFAFLGSIPPAGLASFIAPRLFGDEVHGQWGELLAPNFYVHADTLYVGFFTLVLALVALLTRRDRWHVRFFGWFSLAVLWLALGKFGYLYRAIVYVPLLKNTRDIGTIGILIPLSASVLAAFGLDRYLAPGRIPEVWRTVLRLLILVLCALMLIVGITVWPPQRLMQSDPLIARALGESAAFVLLVFIVSAFLLWARSRYNIAQAWLAGAVIAFIAADLLYFAFPFINAGTDIRALSERDAVIQYLAQDRSLYRVYGLDDRGMVFNIQDARGEFGSSFLSARYSEYTNFLQGYDLDTYERPGGPDGVIISRGFDSPLIALLNVKYAVLSARELEAAGLRGAPGVIEVVPGTFLYRNARVHPRVLDSYGYKVLDDRLSILRELNRRDYDPHRFIVLERTPGIPPNIFPPEGPAGPPANLTVTSYEDNRVRIHAEFPRAGFLVLNDLYYPEWVAYLDGHRTPIYRANYLFRAVVVPPGSHDVSFVYRDRALARGAAVSGLAGLCGVVGWILDAARQRRRRTAA